MFSKSVKCEKGHKYDKKKHSSCPYCGVNINLDIVKALHKTHREDGSVDLDGLVQQMDASFTRSNKVVHSRDNKETSTVLQDQDCFTVVQDDYGDANTVLHDENYTVLAEDTNDNRLAGPAISLENAVRLDEDWSTSPEAVVGWLVALEGPNKYKDLTVFGDSTFIGISYNGELISTRDSEIVARVFLQVTYDNNTKDYKLLSEADVIINGSDQSSAVINEGDIIQVRGNKLVFKRFV